MDNDDAQVGRLLSRREVLALFGAAGAALLVGCSDDDAQPAPTSGAATQAPTSPSAVATSAATASAVPSCVVRPEQTEGPYFVDEQLDRSDIRVEPSDGSAKEGVPVTLLFNVSSVSSGACTPLAGATVDVWHCDALGVYSGVNDTAEGFNTVGQKFLRGYQVTDAAGQARFTTVYPGWYQGRTVHIHFKIRTDSGAEFTSQLFFDDTLTDEVFAQAPYAEKGERTLRNDGDMIFSDGGDQLLLALTPDGAGYAATFDIGLEMG